jgi:hypothetical protein
MVSNITIADQAISTTTGDTLELSTEMKSLLADQVQLVYQQISESLLLIIDVLHLLFVTFFTKCLGISGILYS